MQKRILYLVFGALVAVAVYFMLASPVETKKEQLYVFLPSADNPFWIEVRNGAETAAKDYSKQFDVRILTAGDMDAANQVEQLQSALERGKVTAIVLGVANNRAPAPVIAKYNAKGIPVVMIDTDLDVAAKQETGARWDAFIGSDNRFGGKLAASTMADALKDISAPRVLLIKGSYVHQSAIDRAEGFIEGTENKFQLVEREGEWSRQRAMEITAGVIAREPVQGIFASNDDMALGAIAALNNLGLDKNQWPVVIGFDATEAGRDAILSGEMYASIGQQATEMGNRGVTSAIKLAEGKTLEETMVLVPVAAVFLENLTQ